MLLSLICVINILPITFLSLDQGLAKFSSKEPDSDCFTLCGPQMVSFSLLLPPKTVF